MKMCLWLSLSLGASPLSAGSGIPLSTTAAAQAALQLNGAIPLGALNPAALTGKVGNVCDPLDGLVWGGVTLMRTLRDMRSSHNL